MNGIFAFCCSSKRIDGYNITRNSNDNDRFYTSRIATSIQRIDTLYYLLSQLRGGRIRRLPIVLYCYDIVVLPERRSLGSVSGTSTATFPRGSRDDHVVTEHRIRRGRHRNCFYAQNLLRTNSLLIILMYPTRIRNQFNIPRNELKKIVYTLNPPLNCR